MTNMKEYHRRQSQGLFQDQESVISPEIFYFGAVELITDFSCGIACIYEDQNVTLISVNYLFVILKTLKTWSEKKTYPQTRENIANLIQALKSFSRFENFTDFFFFSSMKYGI